MLEDYLSGTQVRLIFYISEAYYLCSSFHQPEIHFNTTDHQMNPTQTDNGSFEQKFFSNKGQLLVFIVLLSILLAGIGLLSLVYPASKTSGDRSLPASEQESLVDSKLLRPLGITRLTMGLYRVNKIESISLQNDLKTIIIEVQVIGSLSPEDLHSNKPDAVLRVAYSQDALKAPVHRGGDVIQVNGSSAGAVVINNLQGKALIR